MKLDKLLKVRKRNLRSGCFRLRARLAALLFRLRESALSLKHP